MGKVTIAAGHLLCTNPHSPPRPSPPACSITFAMAEIVKASRSFPCKEPYPLETSFVTDLALTFSLAGAANFRLSKPLGGQHSLSQHSQYLPVALPTTRTGASYVPLPSSSTSSLLSFSPSPLLPFFSPSSLLLPFSPSVSIANRVPDPHFGSSAKEATTYNRRSYSNRLTLPISIYQFYFSTTFPSSESRVKPTLFSRGTVELKNAAMLPFSVLYLLNKASCAIIRINK